MKIVSFGPEHKKLTKKIIDFQNKLYEKDKNFVPQLRMELLGSKLLGAKGLLRKDHPFHKHAAVNYFMAFDSKNQVTGTIAAVVNHSHNQYHQEQTGFFGFFEVIDDYETAKALLDHAKNWLKGQGMKKMRGPASFSSNENYGLLINAFDELPFLGTPYNKPYYQGFLEQYGLNKAMDLIAERMPVTISQDDEEAKRFARLANFSEKIMQRNNISLENFNSQKPEKHLALIKEIYAEAWKDNWGYVPMTDEEFSITADGLKIAADPLLIKFASIQGETGAFIGTLPDINEVLSRSKKLPELLKLIRLFYWLKMKKFTRVRLLLFGIKEKFRKMGLDGVLFIEEFKAARVGKRKYSDCEISWLLETNHLVINAAEKLNAYEYKRWRIFETEI